MALSIVNNTSSLYAQLNLNQTQAALNTSLQSLSTGLKINSAADGPAALVIAQEQQSQVTGLSATLSSAGLPLTGPSGGGISTGQALAAYADPSASATIVETNFAAETANFTQQNVLLQSGTQVLKTAEQTSQLVLSLLQGL